MTSRWFKVALALSVAFNVLFVGVVIGRAMSDQPLTKPYPPDFGWMIRGLGEESGENLRMEIRDQARQARPAKRKLRLVQREVNLLLLQEPIDQEALVASMADLRKASMIAQQAQHESMITIMQALSPEQRKKALSYLDTNWHKEMRKRHGRKRPPPP